MWKTKNVLSNRKRNVAEFSVIVEESESEVSVELGKRQKGLAVWLMQRE